MHDTPKSSTIVASKELSGNDGDCEFKLSSANDDNVWFRAPCNYGLNVGDSIMVISKKRYRELTGGYNANE